MGGSRQSYQYSRPTRQDPAVTQDQLERAREQSTLSDWALVETELRVPGSLGRRSPDDLGDPEPGCGPSPPLRMAARNNFISRRSWSRLGAYGCTAAMSNSRLMPGTRYSSAEELPAGDPVQGPSVPFPDPDQAGEHHAYLRVGALDRVVGDLQQPRVTARGRRRSEVLAVGLGPDLPGRHRQRLGVRSELLLIRTVPIAPARSIALTAASRKARQAFRAPGVSIGGVRGWRRPSAGFPTASGERGSRAMRFRPPSGRWHSRCRRFDSAGRPPS